MNRIMQSKPRKFMGKQAGFRIGQWGKQAAPTPAVIPHRTAASAGDALRVRQRQAYEQLPEGNLKRGGR